MARDEQHAYLMGAAEALLFVSDEPVGTARIAEMLGIEASQAQEVLELLSAEYAEDNRGMQLREVAGGWRFYTHPAYHDIIERYVISWDTHRMSQAALEALAIIAYHQPVTRASVNAIRGVNSDGVISSLVEKGLVRELGRDKPGGAILYGTTRAFLERFGLKSVSDLPPLEDFAPDEASREQIRERLSGAGKMPDVQLELDGEESLAEGQAQDALSADGEPQAMADVIGQAMTEKVEFDIFEFDDEDDDEPVQAPVEDEEDDVAEEETEDDVIDYAEHDEEEAYDRDFDAYDDDEDEDDDGYEEDDADDEDDEIEFVE